MRHPARDAVSVAERSITVIMKRLLSGIIACALATAVSRGQTPTPTPVPSVCAGDCNGDGQVTVDELVTLISIALNGGTAGCPNVALWCDNNLGVQCVIQAVGSALNGCPASASDGSCMLALTLSCASATPFSDIAPSRQACCAFLQTDTLPGTIYWCPAANFDPATGRCTACADPCVGLPCNSQADCEVGLTCADSRCCPTAPPGACFPTPVVP